MAVITLLTDFGLSDEYAGVMKGVVLSICPDAVIVDLTHAVDPQDIVQGACILSAAWPYFPAGTIHLAVVDPGVGTSRAAIAARIEGHFFIAPDNGLLTPLLNHYTPEYAVQIENTAFFRAPVSQTFHGRDIFSPAAARLAAGWDMADMGPRVQAQRLVRLDAFKPATVSRDEHRVQVTGRVMYADHFGNLITNLDAGILEKESGETLKCAGKHWRIRIRDGEICGILNAYEHAGLHQPLAITGSRGAIEIAVNAGSAADYYHAGPGEPVIAVMEKPL